MTFGVSISQIVMWPCLLRKCKFRKKGTGWSFEMMAYMLGTAKSQCMYVNCYVCAACVMQLLAARTCWYYRYHRCPLIEVQCAGASKGLGACENFNTKAGHLVPTTQWYMYTHTYMYMVTGTMWPFAYMEVVICACAAAKRTGISL